jgi:Dicarboxylate transport
MTRRLVFVLLAGGAILATVLGAGVIWRVPLAQSLLDWAARDLGVPDARATIEGITSDRLRAIDLAAGERSELTADSVEVDFHLPDIVRGQVDKVTVGGLTVNLDLREGAAPLGSLQPLVDRTGESGRTAAAEPLAAGLPDVELRDGRLQAETPFGPASVAFDGTLAGNQAGGPALTLAGQLSSAWARLTAELSAKGDPQTSAEARLDLSDGTVDLPDDLLRVRKLTGDLDLSVKDGRPQAGRGDLSADGLAVAGTAFDRAHVTFDLNRQQAELTARLSSDDGSFDLAVDGRTEALDTTPHVTLGLRSQIGEAAPVWTFSRPPFPVGGSGQIEIEAAGDFPALPGLPANAAAIQSWLTDGTVSGTLTSRLSRLSLPQSEAEIESLVDLDAAWADGALGLTTREENRVTARGLEATDLAALGLPAGLADELVRLAGGTLSLALPAPAQPPATLVWRPGDPVRTALFDGSAIVTAGPITATLVGEAEAALQPEVALARADLREVALSASDVTIQGHTIEDLQATGSFAGTPQSFEAAGKVQGRLAALSLNGMTADRLSLSLPFQVSREAQVIDLLIAQPGWITLDGLRAMDLLTADEPIEISLAGGNAKLTLPGPDSGLALAHEARLGFGPTRLLWQTEDGGRVPLELSLPNLKIAGELGDDGRYRGRATVRDAELSLPESSLAFDGISADLELSGEPERAAADFQIAAARHLASPAAFAPLRLSGRTVRRGDTVELSAQVRRTDSEPLAEVAATHDLASGSGHAEITVLPLRFEPGGLQPGALSPWLAALSDVRGRAEGAADLTWDRDGLAGTARFVVQDLSFARADTTVSGLDLDLELDSLQPPASPPHQRLSADLIDVGVPLKDFEARFQMLPNAPGQILLEEASFATIGSHVAIHDTLIDPTSERLDTQLSVSQLDVGALFDVLAVDGLSGSGELAGTIPIERDGDRVIIENARLEAGGPGVLRFRSDAAARALAGGGEHVDLVIKALQDFHYQTLTLTGNLDRDGEANLRLEILGNNPDVLDGYPFQLNINLTGNPAPILEVLQLSRTVIKDILERARRLSR